MWLTVEAPHFVAGINFVERQSAPILRWALRYTQEQFITIISERGWILSTNINGQVEKINYNEGPYGKLYNFTVKGTRYGVGKSQLGVVEGDWIEFQAEQKGQYWNMVKGTLKAIEAPKTGSAPVKQQAPAQQAQSYGERQNAITFQSARNAAIDYVDMLLRNNLIDLGKSKNLADKQSIVEVYVDKHTEHFVNECNALKTSNMNDSKPEPLTENGDGDSLDGVF